MRANGFTLAEVLVAVAILTVMLISVAALLGFSLRLSQAAEQITMASTLAAARIEQLRSLAWGFDVEGRPVADTTTDLSTPEPSASGSGLSASPAGTLRANVPGFVDYLDLNGRWLGRGASAPPATAYIRRWAIVPGADSQADMCVLEVVVLPIAGIPGGGSSGRAAGTRLVAVKVRTLW